MLLDKNASENLKHIKQITKLINALNYFSYARVILVKQNISNDLYRASQKSRKYYSQQDTEKKVKEVSKEEQRVSIETLKTSANQETDSILLNLLLIFREVALLILWIIFFLPFQIIFNKLKSWFI
jgi:hypothetical protein